MRTIMGSQRGGMSKRVGALSAAVFATVLLAGRADPAAAQGMATGGVQNAQVEIAYVQPSNRNYVPIYTPFTSSPENPQG